MRLARFLQWTFLGGFIGYFLNPYSPSLIEIWFAGGCVVGLGVAFVFQKIRPISKSARSPSPAAYMLWPIAIIAVSFAFLDLKIHEMHSMSVVIICTFLSAVGIWFAEVHQKVMSWKKDS